MNQLEKIGLSTIIAILLWMASGVREDARKISDSVAILNERVAVVIEQVSSSRSQLRDHDERIGRLERRPR